MLWGKCGSGNRDGIAPAGLVGCQEIHLAFDKNGTIELAHVELGFVEAIENARLMK